MYKDAQRIEPQYKRHNSKKDETSYDFAVISTVNETQQFYSKTKDIQQQDTPVSCEMLNH